MNPSSSSYRIAILGAGALGAIYGSILFEADPDSVSFIASGERYRRLTEEGILVNGRRFPIPVVRPEDATPVDLVLVAVKYHHLDQAIADMRQAVGRDTAILSVMNGVDSEERIGAVYGRDKMLYGLALGIDAVRDGNSISYTNQGRILFGERTNTGLSARVRRLDAVFDHAGVAHVNPPDMIRSLWFKFMINVGTNQVSAVLGANYGAMRTSAPARELMDAAMREVIAIARELELDLSEKDFDEWYRVLGTLDASGKTSMLQDVEAGRKTEVEMLAGIVLELGRRHGIATPVNRKLFDELRAIEAASKVGA